MTPYKETVLCARLRGNSFELKLDKPIHTVGFITYQEFYDAIGHTNINVAVANRLYYDGDSILSKPDDFLCLKCIRAKSTH